MSTTVENILSIAGDNMTVELAFQEISITLQSDEGPYEITVMEGVETGLAYYWDRDQYCITSLSTGKRVCDVEAITTIFNCVQMNNEVVIQCLIQQMAGLLDWQLDESGIKAQFADLFTTGKGFGRWLREAFDRACHESRAN